MGTPGGGRATWHRWANLPTLGWLAAVAVLALAHRAVADSAWLLVHLTLLGAVTNAIMVYSWHFSEALLRLPVPSRRPLAVRLVLLNVGSTAAMAGVVLAAWPLTVGGATAVGAASAWHGAAILARARRALPSRFASTVRYYLASCSLLPFGAAAGAALAVIGDSPGDGPGEWHARLLVAHESLNVLGWVGLTVLGTLVTLLPTMLRTRADDAAEPTSRSVLWLLLAGVVAAAGGAVSGAQWVTAAGIAAYLTGVVASSVPLARTVARKAPVDFAPLSAVASMLWLVVALAWLLVLCVTEPDWMMLHEAAAELTPVLAAGFAAQVLLGALAYLLPVVLGGGPALVRARTEALNAAAWFRVVLANGAILLYVLPVPSTVRVAAAVAGLIPLCVFLWLVVKAVRAQATPKLDASRQVETRSRYGSGALGLAVLLVGVVVGAGVDPSVVTLTQGSGAAGASAVTPTGHTTTVDVTMSGMHFSPSAVTVPAGEHVVVRLHNADPTPHDLTLANGKASPRVAPGASTDFDAGVIGASLDGWCSVVGHREMGMTFRITVGTPNADNAATTGNAPFTPFPAELPPALPGPVHRITLTVQDTVRAVAPGVTQELWTYNGTAPGPILHGHVGDRFEITLVNRASMGHSIDFHAGSVAPDEPMRTIPPGETGTYTFTATAPGIWLYHCSTMPMSLHIANGMFGAVVIDQPDAPPVAQQFVLIQSELYYGQRTNSQASIADSAKIAAEKPDAVVFNGYADQYKQAPLPVKAGQPVRVWVLDAGPDRPTSFHVVGAQFSAVWAEGAFRLPPGAGASQAMDLAPGQGGYVDLTFPEAGNYPFVTHYMVDAERGAEGMFSVTAGIHW